MNKKKIFSLIVKNLKKEGVKKIAVFGSYARGNEKKKSDIDLIVSFRRTKSLLELVKIEQNLSEVTGRKIDLLTEGSISPYISENIKKGMVRLY